MLCLIVKDLGFTIIFASHELKYDRLKTLTVSFSIPAEQRSQMEKTPKPKTLDAKLVQVNAKRNRGRHYFR